MSKRLIGFFLILILVLVECAAPPRNSPIQQELSPAPLPALEQGFYRGEGIGPNFEDAKRRARREILDQGVQTYLKSQAISSISQSRLDVITTSTSGFMTDFRIVQQGTVPGGYRVVADAKVVMNEVHAALHEQLEAIDRPRVLFLVTEVNGSQSVAPGESEIEYMFYQKFNDPKASFDLGDWEQLRRRFKREGTQLVGVFDDQTAEDRAIQLALEMDIEILIIGKFIGQKGRPFGEGIDNYDGNIQIKILNVGAAENIGALVDRATYPGVEAEKALSRVKKLLVDKSYEALITQVMGKWKRGNKIRVIVEGISYDAFTDSNFQNMVRTLPDVSALYNRGKSNISGSIELEVQAKCNGPRLYEMLRKVRKEAGLEFELVEIRGNIVRIKAKAMSAP